MASVGEIIDDVKATFTERLKNPFIASFILSWLASNWLILYKVMTFEAVYSYEERIKILTDYFAAEKWDKLTLTPLWHSGIIALIYIACSIIFILMFNFYNSSIKAELNEISNSKGNVTKEENDYYIKENEKIQKELNQLRKVKSDSKAEVDRAVQALTTMTKKYDSANEGFNNHDRKLKEVEKLNETLNRNLEKANNEITQLSSFRKDIEDNIQQSFIEKRTYTIAFTKKLGDLELPGELADLPVLLKAPLQVRFKEMNIINVNSQDVLFRMQDFKSTNDGKIISFDWVNNANMDEKVRVYLIRNGQMFHSGYGICKDRPLFVRITIKPF